MTFITHLPLSAFNGSANTKHQDVMAMFPADLPGDERTRRAVSHILFGAVGDILIIRSDIEPTSGPASRKTFTERTVPAAGDIIRFHVDVNAVRRGRTGGVTPVDDIETWVGEKLAPALEDVTVLQHQRTVTSSGRSPLQVDSVDGQAVVGDRDALMNLLRTGVGRAKAYGCGLLLVAS